MYVQIGDFDNLLLLLFSGVSLLRIAKTVPKDHSLGEMVFYCVNILAIWPITIIDVSITRFSISGTSMSCFILLGYEPVTGNYHWNNFNVIQSPLALQLNCQNTWMSSRHLHVTTEGDLADNADFFIFIDNIKTILFGIARGVRRVLSKVILTTSFTTTGSGLYWKYCVFFNRYIVCACVFSSVVDARFYYCNWRVTCSIIREV